MVMGVFDSKALSLKCLLHHVAKGCVNAILQTETVELK